MTREERFWAKGTPEPTTGCLLWTGDVDDHGYGRTNTGREEGVVLVHRLAWRYATGADAGPLCVLHRCDNRACFEPRHLFCGTRPENSADMVAKRRQARGDRQGMRRHPERVPRGERNGAARLREEQVRDIRARCAAGEPQEALARVYAVSQATVSAVHLRKRWAHVL